MSVSNSETRTRSAVWALGRFCFVLFHFGGWSWCIIICFSESVSAERNPDVWVGFLGTLSGPIVAGAQCAEDLWLELCELQTLFSIIDLKEGNEGLSQLFVLLLGSPLFSHDSSKWLSGPFVVIFLKVLPSQLNKGQFSLSKFCFCQCKVKKKNEANQKVYLES